MASFKDELGVTSGPLSPAYYQPGCELPMSSPSSSFHLDATIDKDVGTGLLYFKIVIYSLNILLLASYRRRSRSFSDAISLMSPRVAQLRELGYATNTPEQVILDDMHEGFSFIYFLLI